MSTLEQILNKMILVVDKMKKDIPPLILIVFVNYGHYVIAVKIKEDQPISRIMNYVLTKHNLVHANYKLENSIGIELIQSWPCGIFNQNENIYIKQKK